VTKLIYISEGNIPSSAANSIQVMKMSQAFAGLLPQFELVTAGDFLSFFRKPEFNLWKWYGIANPFKVAALPLQFRSPCPLPADYRRGSFPYLAAWYALARRAHVVYTRSGRAAWYAANWGLPVALETHRPSEQPNSERGGILAHPNLIGIVTISPELAETYAAAGVPPERVVTAPDGVDLERFAEVPAKSEARRILHLPEGHLVVYVGHLYEHRGIEVILDVADLAPDVQFRLVGGWPDQVGRRRKEIESRGLKNVELSGFIANADVPLYLAAADVLVMPYSRRVRTAAWMSPMKMFEYMAAARPILGSDLPSVRSVLSHAETAWLVEPDNAQALHHGLRHLISHPETAERLGRNARHAVDSDTWDARAKMILEKLRLDSAAETSRRVSICYPARAALSRRLARLRGLLGREGSA